MSMFILIELLLIFGREFSKFHLFSVFYLYDFLFILLGLIGLIVLIVNRKFSFHWPIISFIGISIIYLAYSLIFNIGPINYIARHFAIFAYLAIFYVIYQAYIDRTRHELNIRFILLIIALSVLFQIGYYFYYFIMKDSFQLLGEFNYYSPMTIMGIIMFSAFVLSYPLRISWKVSLYCLALFLSITLGHASSFLACFIMLFAYLGFKVIPALKVQLLILGALSTIVIYLMVPAFSDVNTSWRLIYWKDILTKQITEQYGVIGNGFGVPFVDDKLATTLLDELRQSSFDYQPEERFLSPPHNSFITFIFHIGLLPALLLFLPLKRPFQYIAGKPRIPSFRKEFLLLGFIGLTIWSSFNVVLELPHSSAFYWLVYFSLIFQFNIQHTDEFDQEK